MEELFKQVPLGEVAISWYALFMTPPVIAVHSVYAKWGKMQMFMQNEGYCRMLTYTAFVA